MGAEASVTAGLDGRRSQPALKSFILSGPKANSSGMPEPFGWRGG